MQNLPSGTVTFFITDIEGSTQRWERDSEVMSRVRARHEAILREVITRHGGVVFKGTGDGVLAAFASAPDALEAAIAAQRALFAEDWSPADPLRVRVALHTGLAEVREGDYFGQPVNRVARILSAGYGGQTLISNVTQELVRDNLPPGVELRDMGEARLKDLLRPMRIYQIIVPDLPSDFPPLKTLDARRSNLPAQATLLVGRERETAEVVALLRQEGVRLVTLTGPGGIGKTRLGVQVAAESADLFRDGVFYIPLEEVVDPTRVTSQIAETLGVTEGGGQPLSTRLYAAVRDQTLLLLLDNFEHVTIAGVALSQLLAAAPGVKVLVTSRSALHVYGEREYPVPPLQLPQRRTGRSVEQMMQSESVRLFVARAQEAKPDFTLTAANAHAVAEICQRLDGLPLAIELAAARIKLLTPHALLQRLTNSLEVLKGGARNLPARQQTLRGAIDWSYAALGPSEQTLFARMAVFVSGGTLSAIETVCNPGGDLALDILDGLSSLADKSLVRQVEGHADEPRFLMLRTIREYALEQLEKGGGADAIRTAHADYYTALAEEAESYLVGPMQGIWLARLEEEHDNLRAALRSAQDAGRHEIAVRLVGAIWRFWSIRGYLTEGRRLMERALAQADDVSAPLKIKALDGLAALMRAQGDDAGARAIVAENLAIARTLGHQGHVSHALGALGEMALDARDFATAKQYLDESLAIRRATGDIEGSVRTLTRLGRWARMQGDTAAARGYFEESLTVARGNGYTEGAVNALNNLGVIEQGMGDLATARARYEEVLSVARSLGDTATAGFALNNLGAVAKQQGDYAAARAFYEQSLAQWREIGNMSRIATALMYLGMVAEAQGDYDAARAYDEECLAIRRELGDARALPFPLNNLALVARKQGDYEAARAAYQESLTIAQHLNDPRGMIEALEGLGGVFGARGEGHRAALLWAAVDALREQHRLARIPEEQERYEREREEARKRTDARVWARAWAEGGALDLTQSVERATVDAAPDEADTQRPPPPGVPDRVAPFSA